MPPADSSSHALKQHEVLVRLFDPLLYVRTEKRVVLSDDAVSMRDPSGLNAADRMLSCFRLGIFSRWGERLRTVANEGTGGEGGIRTPDTVTRMPHFECGAFNHSATSPWPQGANILSVGGYVSNARRLNKNGLSPMQRLIMSPRARGAGRRT